VNDCAAQACEAGRLPWRRLSCRGRRLASWPHRRPAWGVGPHPDEFGAPLRTRARFSSTGWIARWCSGRIPPPCSPGPTPRRVVS